MISLHPHLDRRAKFFVFKPPISSPSSGCVRVTKFHLTKWFSSPPECSSQKKFLIKSSMIQIAFSGIKKLTCSIQEYERERTYIRWYNLLFERLYLFHFSNFPCIFLSRAAKRRIVSDIHLKVALQFNIDASTYSLLSLMLIPHNVDLSQLTFCPEHQ